MSDELGDKTPTNEPTPQDVPDKGLEVDKTIQSVMAQKEHYREKVEKLEKELSDLKKEPIRVEPQDPMEIVKLSKAFSGYDEDESNFILRNAKGKNPQDIIDAANDPWVKAAIEANREKVKRESKIPSPDNPSSGGFEPKTMSDLANMSDEDFEKYQRGLWEKSQRGKGGNEGL